MPHTSYLMKYFMKEIFHKAFIFVVFSILIFLFVCMLTYSLWQFCSSIYVSGLSEVKNYMFTWRDVENESLFTYKPTQIWPHSVGYFTVEYTLPLFLQYDRHFLVLLLKTD